MFSIFNVGIFTSMTSKDSLKALSQVWLSQALHRIPRSNAHAWSINSKRGTIDLIDSKKRRIFSMNRWTPYKFARLATLRIFAKFLFFRPNGVAWNILWVWQMGWDMGKLLWKLSTNQLELYKLRSTRWKCENEEKWQKAIISCHIIKVQGHKLNFHWRSCF